MAKEVTVGEAQAQFLSLIRRVEAGEEFVLWRGRKPVARIVPLKRAGGASGFGSLKGLVKVGKDFDEPLEDLTPYE